MAKEGLFIAWSRPLSEWSRQVSPKNFLICDFNILLRKKALLSFTVQEQLNINKKTSNFDHCCLHRQFLPA
jgi:hypothetical protein